MGCDSVYAAARHRSILATAVSVERSPSDRCSTNETFRLLPFFKKGLPLRVQPGSVQPDERTTAAANVPRKATEPSPEMPPGASSRRSPHMVGLIWVVHALFGIPLPLPVQ